MKKVKHLPLIICMLLLLTSGFSYAMEVGENTEVAKNGTIGIQAYEEQVISRISQRFTYSGQLIGSTISYTNIQFFNGYSVSTRVEESFHLAYWEKITYYTYHTY